MTFLPPDAGVAYSFIEIIADPKKAKAYLDDIVEKTKALGVAGEAARSDRIAADAALAEAEKTLQKITDFHNKYDTDYTTRSAKLDAKEADLNSREASLVKTRNSLLADISAFEENKAERDAFVTARETSVAVREKALASQEAETLRLKTEYEQKLSALKAAIN